jgi:hypothetical protein
MEQEKIKQANQILERMNAGLVKQIEDLKREKAALKEDNDYLAGRVEHLEETILGCPEWNWYACTTCPKYKQKIG